MDSIALSGRAKTFLAAQGLPKASLSEIQDVEQFLTEKGIQASPGVLEFLRHFHGTFLLPPDDGLSFFCFDVFKVFVKFNLQELRHFESVVGCALCPIGEGGRYIGLMSAFGQVFLLHDEWLNYLRMESISDAMDAILFLDAKNYVIFNLDEAQMPEDYRY